MEMEELEKAAGGSLFYPPCVESQVWAAAATLIICRRTGTVRP